MRPEQVAGGDWKQMCFQLSAWLRNQTCNPEVGGYCSDQFRAITGRDMWDLAMERPLFIVSWTRKVYRFTCCPLFQAQEQIWKLRGFTGHISSLRHCNELLRARAFQLRFILNEPCLC